MIRPKVERDDQSRLTFGLLICFGDDAVNFLLFFHHNFQDGLVGLDHSGSADPSHVSNCGFRRCGGDAVGRTYHYISNCQISAHKRSAGCRGKLQCTADLSAVTDHSGYVAAHIDDGVADLLITAAHEIDEGCGGGRCSRHAAAACGGKLAGEGFYVNIDGVGESQGFYQLFPGGM